LDYLTLKIITAHKEIEKIMERDKYFSPEEAIKFGLIDKVITNRK
jgi:ATP-dependent protease ClpP protease subunit